MSKKLSQQLDEADFFCAFGTTERFSVRGVKVKLRVEAREPFCIGYNNYVVVVYDERGRPWVKLEEEVDAPFLEDYALKEDAYVPHSEDECYFMTMVVPKLMDGLSTDT